MPNEAQRSVVAAVSGRHMDETVVTTAALEARHRHAALVLLHVIEVGHALPLDTSNEAQILAAERVVSTAKKMAPGNRLEVRTEIRQARAASAAIIETAIEQSADAIVVGTHRFLGELDCDLGYTATHVLRHAPVPVIACYDPIR